MLPLIPNPRARRLFLDRHALSEAPVGAAEVIGDGLTNARDATANRSTAK